MNIYNGPLRITQETLDQIAQVQAYAFTHRETLRDLRNRMSTGTHNPGTIPEHCLEIPVGYQVIYSIEQNEPGWCHHFAISVTQPKMDPSPGAVTRILEAFGLRNLTPKGILQEAIQIWGEQVSQTNEARNLLYPIKNFAEMQQRMEGLLQAAPKSE